MPKRPPQVRSAGVYGEEDVDMFSISSVRMLVGTPTLLATRIPPKNLRNIDRKQDRKRRGDRTFELLSLNLIMLVQQCRTATHKWRSLYRERSH
jgi:hypothetical protein